MVEGRYGEVDMAVYTELGMYLTRPSRGLQACLTSIHTQNAPRSTCREG